MGKRSSEREREREREEDIWLLTLINVNEIPKYTLPTKTYNKEQKKQKKIKEIKGKWRLAAADGSRRWEKMAINDDRG